MFGRSQGGPTESICIHDRNNEGGVETTALRYTPSPELRFATDSNGKTILLEKNEKVKITREEDNGTEKYYLVRKENGISGWVRAKYIKCLPKGRVQLPNINNFLNSPKLLPSQLNNNSWSVGFQPKYNAGISGLQGQSASFSRFPAQAQFRPPNFSRQPARLPEFPVQPRQPTFPRDMAALYEHSLENSPENSDVLYNAVLKVQKDRRGRIEKVSNDKYIIHFSENSRKIFERSNSGLITETNSYGPLVFTEANFDNQIIRIIESKMRTSETNLEDLLELCRETYFGMFQRQIPPKKLDELKKSIMKNPIRQNVPNPIFYKQS